jgi:ABC-type nitrate/sulfonate/bicarbonate transport system substrate-binding protein
MWRLKTMWRRKAPALLIVVGSLIVAACGGGGEGPSTAAGAPPGSQLSTPNLRISYVPGVGEASTAWLAQRAGFFRANDLNVTLVPITSGVTNIIAALVGGSVDVACHSGPSAAFGAFDNGASLRAIWSTGKGVDFQLVINKKVAQEKGIPLSGSPKKQIQALRRSGLQIDFPSSTGDAYTAFALGMIRDGLDPRKDVSVSFAGSGANIYAAFKSGQVQAFGSASPSIFQVSDSNVVRIEYRAAFDGESNIEQFWCFTTPAFAKAHPDTLVAFSRGMVQARALVINNGEVANNDLRAFWQEAGITDAAVQARATQRIRDNIVSQGTPAIQRSSFQQSVDFVNELRQKVDNPPGKPVTATYGNFVDNRYVAQALKELGFNVPAQ